MGCSIRGLDLNAGRACTTSCRSLVSFIEVGLSAAHFLCFKRRQRVAKPRDCPCQPRAPARVRIRATVEATVRSGVGLVWPDVQD